VGVSEPPRGTVPHDRLLDHRATETRTVLGDHLEPPAVRTITINNGSNGCKAGAAAASASTT
jgi:hypothetical protein